MKKFTKYILFIMLTSFLFIFNVHAECSYQERKELLNDSKSVEAYFDLERRIISAEKINPNTDLYETIEEEQYYFNLNIANLSDNLFIKVTNNYNEEQLIVNANNINNNLYTYEISNLTDIITYYLTFYTTKENCYAEKINTIELKKPKENPLYYFSVCNNEKLENNKYCDHFITKDFNMNIYDIVDKLNNIIDEQNVDSKSDINFFNKIINIFKKYWYLFLVVFVIIILIIFLLIYRKRKNELWLKKICWK